MNHGDSGTLCEELNSTFEIKQLNPKKPKLP